MKTEKAIGWGLRVGGPAPYLAWTFQRLECDVVCTEPYHRRMKCVLIPLREWKRLKRMDVRR